MLTAIACFTGTSGRPLRQEMLSYFSPRVLRLSRVLRQPRGHALLTGAAGSGRKSVARLTASIACAQVFEVRQTLLLYGTQFDTSAGCMLETYQVVFFSILQHACLVDTCLHCLQLDFQACTSEAATSDVLKSAICHAGMENAKTVLLVSLPPDGGNLSWTSALSHLLAGEDARQLLPAADHKKVTTVPHAQLRSRIEIPAQSGDAHVLHSRLSR